MISSHNILFCLFFAHLQDFCFLETSKKKFMMWCEQDSFFLRIIKSCMLIAAIYFDVSSQTLPRVEYFSSLTEAIIRYVCYRTQNISLHHILGLLFLSAFKHTFLEISKPQANVKWIMNFSMIGKNVNKSNENFFHIFFSSVVFEMTK